MSTVREFKRLVEVCGSGENISKLAKLVGLNRLTIIRVLNNNDYSCSRLTIEKLNSYIERVKTSF